MLPRIGYAQVVPEDGPANPEHATASAAIARATARSRIELNTVETTMMSNVAAANGSGSPLALSIRMSGCRARATVVRSGRRSIPSSRSARAPYAMKPTSSSPLRQPISRMRRSPSGRRSWRRGSCSTTEARSRLRGCDARVVRIPARGVPRLLVIGIDTVDTPCLVLGSRGRSARSVCATRTHVMSSIRSRATRAHSAVSSPTTI
jgi:hypothetical protein